MGSITYTDAKRKIKLEYFLLFTHLISSPKLGSKFTLNKENFGKHKAYGEFTKISLRYVTLRFIT